MEILLPKMGESVAEATIIRWSVEEGQRVSADEPLIEIATDKVDSEVPAPEDGVLVKRLVSESIIHCLALKRNSCARWKGLAYEFDFPPLEVLKHDPAGLAWGSGWWGGEKTLVQQFSFWST